MTNTVSAAATGLPSRRRALASLAGFGAALSLPKVAQAAAGLDAPDAVLIAHAAMVEEMAARLWTAYDRLADVEEKLDNLRPSHPQPVETKDEASSVEIERGPDGRVTVMRWGSVDPATGAAKEQHKADYEAWEQACADLEESLGVNDATQLTNDLSDLLSDLVADLTSMAATTPAGLAAKARAAVALDPHHDCSMDGREQALFVSLAQNVVSIGGAA